MTDDTRFSDSGYHHFPFRFQNKINHIGKFTPYMITNIFQFSNFCIKNLFATFNKIHTIYKFSNKDTHIAANQKILRFLHLNTHK